LVDNFNIGPTARERAIHLIGDILSKSVILFIIAGVGSLGWFVWDDFVDEWDVFLFEKESSFLVPLGKISLVIAILATIWKIYLAATYRPETPCEDSLLPTCSVIIPAYNESEQVLKSLLSVAASDYPPEKMQIIAVDDGSKDDTWQWMQKAAEQLKGRVELVRQAKNGGKRRALYAGFQKSTGEILVTIDSDSEVKPDSLRHLVTPFVRDPIVGAVAGNVRVLNTHQGIIPKMLEVNYAFSFDFIRASQSRINTVLTTPGALSGYRGKVVRQLMDAWVNQRFLGREANIGEDRAMTNMILREGYLARFARRALVLTQVPVDYWPLCKMFLRWARSNLRETLIMATFIFKKFRTASTLGARVLFLLHLFSMFVTEVLKVGSLSVVFSLSYLMSYNVLLGMAIGGLIPGLFYLLSHRNSNFLWAFPYSCFYVFALSWISFYALFTPHRNGWLNRGLKKAAAQ